MIQEHNIPKEENSVVRELANEFGFHTNISHGESEAQRGGTLLLIKSDHFDEVSDSRIYQRT